MADIQPISYVDMLWIMIVENKNEIQKNEILERVALRQQLGGTKIDQMLGMLQQKIRALKASLIDLEDIHKDALAQQNKKPV